MHCILPRVPSLLLLLTVCSGELADCKELSTTPIFGLQVPRVCTGVPAEVLMPGELDNSALCCLKCRIMHKIGTYGML